MLDIRTTPVGVWVDANVRGRYTGEAIQWIATSYGWEGEPLDADDEFYDEATTSAEYFMSDLSPVGHLIASNFVGDFGMWPIKENGEELWDDSYLCV